MLVAETHRSGADLFDNMTFPALQAGAGGRNLTAGLDRTIPGNQPPGSGGP